MTGRRPSHIVLLALALLAPTASPCAAAEVSKFLPEATEVVAFINVRRLLGAPLVQRHALEQVKAALQDNAELHKLLTAARFDPLRDVQSVTLAAPGSDAQNRAVFIVSGAFDADRIHAVAEEV